MEQELPFLERLGKMQDEILDMECNKEMKKRLEQVRREKLSKLSNVVILDDFRKGE
jgi:CHAD domain-containing protein